MIGGIPDYAFEMWMKSDMEVRTQELTLTTSPALLWKANAMRFALQLTSTASQIVIYRFGKGGTNNAMWAFNAGQPWAFISRDDIGDAITQEVYAWAGAAAGIYIQEYSYKSSKYAAYQRIISEWLEGFVGG
jgi:hypothetical protein